MKTIMFAAAAAVLASVGTVAQAAPVMESITRTVVGTGGFADDLEFDFTSLAPSNGAGGLLTIATGDATLAPSFPGLDLHDYDVSTDTFLRTDDEFFSLSADGLSLGKYTCGLAEGATVIPGATLITADADCAFSLTVAIGGVDLDAMLADGRILVDMLFGGGVNDFGDGDTVTATLSYENVTSVIPLPAAAPLMLAGLGLLGFVGRRRRAI